MKLELEKEPGSEGDWTPSNEQDRKQFAAELELLLNAEVFRRSGRYSALLRYVVERALEGKTADLKERIIGIEVFNRPNDYDTAADPVVRFCAGEVRKRLAQYYRKSTDVLIEIELPLGSYVPHFHYRKTQPVQTPIEAALKTPTELPLQAPVLIDTPASGTLSPHIFTGTLSARAKLLVAAVAVCLIVVGILLGMKAHQDTTRGIWEPFLNRSIPVNICTGSLPSEVTDIPYDTPNVSIEQHFLRFGHRISIPTATAIATLSGFLQGHNQPFELSEATDESLDNLRNRPLILVNANNNQWTLLLLKPLRFHFESQGQNGYIVDSEHPEQRSWHIDFDQPYRQQTADYAIVARIFDKTMGAPVFVAAGIGSNGTRAAGDFSVSRSQLEELTRNAPRGWQTMNFEAVLKVQIVQGHMGAVQIVAKKFW